MLRPEVSIIIVNYNTAVEIEKCLISVQHSAFNIQHSEIIVVDNASSDNSVSVIKKFPEVRLIENKKNLGFAAACNIGAKIARGDFLFFLNPDTEVKENTIQNLLDFAKNNQNAIIGPRLLNSDGSLQGSCYNLPTILGAISEFWLGQRSAYEKFTPKGDKPTRVEAVVGAAIFMSRQVFEKLGRFNEQYFLYYEDLDFCRRAKKLKIPIIYYPKAVVVHRLGKSGGQIFQLAKSAKIYHGLFKYFILTLIIKGGHIWQKFLNKI